MAADVKATVAPRLTAVNHAKFIVASGSPPNLGGIRRDPPIVYFPSTQRATPTTTLLGSLSGEISLLPTWGQTDPYDLLAK
jgi:hypothetical protein